MREINISNIGENLRDMILHPDPVGEDIIIKSEDGESTLGVVISPEAYEFFLKAVENEEDRLDAQSIEEFRLEDK